MFNQQMMPSMMSSMMMDQNEMPYAYGLSNTNPLPMNPSPISSLPPLYPSMMTPQLNPQAPFTNPNMIQARYAAGGSVYDEDGGYGLTDMAEMLREQGDQDDTILAHINPEEAHQLGEMYGYDINPMTGLPQFGKNKRGILRKIKHTVGHAVRSTLRSTPVRKRLPIAATLAGNVIAPGIGGVLAGAASKATIAKAQHKDPLKAALRGAALGAGLGYGLPLAGQGLSALGATNIGGGLQQFGAGEYMPGLSSIGKAFGLGKGPGATAARQAAGLKGLAQQSALSSFLGGAQQERPHYGLSSLYSNTAPGLPGEVDTAGSLYPALMNMVPGYKEKEGFGLGALSKDLGNMLLPAGIIGTLLRKEKVKHAKEPSYDDIVSHMRTPWTPDQYARPISPFQRDVIQPTEEEIADLEDITKPMRYPNFFRPYAHGGYIDGHSGGQDDDVPSLISEGGFVIPADVVAAIGGGNNAAGATSLKQFSSYLPRYQEDNHGNRKVKAALSSGEYYFNPHEVTAIGKGNNVRGSKILDGFMKNVRQHKGQRPGLPPKAKSLSSYMDHR